MRLTALLVVTLTSCGLGELTSEDPGPAGQAELVVAGGRHACALVRGGKAFCWGAPGMVGDGTRSLRVEAVAVRGMAAAVGSLAAGDSHTCALTVSGSVLCWGDNAFGQLGDGTTSAAREPVELNDLHEDVVQLAAGENHTCALKRTGVVLCWGDNSSLQVSGAVEGRLVLRPVAVLDKGVRSISAGATHTCAVVPNGDIHCWGANTHGELGNGAPSATPSATVQRVLLPGPMMTVAAGRHHTCAATPTGTAWCWGRNAVGEVGDDTSIDRATPVEPVGLPAPIVSLAAGDGVSCAVQEGGSTFCWGNNGSGQLGDGTAIHRARPVRVRELSGRQVATGEGFSCALSRAGKVLCWGKNDEGQLGDGTADSSPMPVQVRGL